MYFRLWAIRIVWIYLTFGASATVGAAGGNHPHGPGASSTEPHHRPNWHFTIPRGEAAKGRAVFEKFECYNCHKINGENFPDPVDYDGPELSQMAPLHPLEFFAESIINPNAVVAKEERDFDGGSPMSQDHLETMTLREFIDLTSYVASLKLVSDLTVTGVGKVVTIKHAAAELMLAHDNFKGFTDAMTMRYRASAPALLEGLEPGDEVHFTIDPKTSTIIKIEKLTK